MIDLIIFDCDGVLVDSEIISAEVLIEELRNVGIKIDRDYVRIHCLGRSFPTVAKAIRESHRMPLPDDFEMRYRNTLLERFETRLRPTEGIAEMLEQLDIRRCVATSSSPPRVARTLELTGLDKYFGEHVYTASLVERGKPAPDLFLHVAKEMGVSKDRILVVEDSIPGITAAKAAEMNVLAYTGASHLRNLGIRLPDDTQSFDNWSDFAHLLRQF